MPTNPASQARPLPRYPASPGTSPTSPAPAGSVWDNIPTNLPVARPVGTTLPASPAPTTGGPLRAPTLQPPVAPPTPAPQAPANDRQMGARGSKEWVAWHQRRQAGKAAREAERARFQAARAAKAGQQKNAMGGGGLPPNFPPIQTAMPQVPGIGPPPRPGYMGGPQY